MRFSLAVAGFACALRAAIALADGGAIGTDPAVQRDADGAAGRVGAVVAQAGGVRPIEPGDRRPIPLDFASADDRAGPGLVAARANPSSVAASKAETIPPSTVLQISSGFAHYLLLRDDGTLWGWGHNGGLQLGDGTSVSRAAPVQILSGITFAAAGAFHSLAVAADGTLWAWGNNSRGQLGDGTRIDRSSPIRVMDGVKSVAAGAYHTIAIKTDGTLWAWGSNSSGEVGDGTQVDRPTPVFIMSDVETATASGMETLDASHAFSIPTQVTISAVLPGAGAFPGSMSMAVTRAGTLWVWGNNYYGQLGVGTTGAAGGQAYSLKPLLLGTNVRRVAAGAYHALLVSTFGTLWSWGKADKGQLGQHAGNPAQPASIATGIVDVSAGGDHSLVLTAGGDLQAWGSNEWGQVVAPVGGTYATPRSIMSGARMIGAGGSSSLAVKNDSSLWAWGDNRFGQLGDAGIVARATPGQVLTGIADVMAGDSHSLALGTDGRLWSWGYNGAGQLADGTFNDSGTPVLAMTGVFSASGGFQRSLVIKTDRALWESGVVQLTGVQAAVPGNGHALALKTDGTLWTWGNNDLGQLGDGTTVSRSTPARILTQVQNIAAGESHSAAITIDGSLWVWGNNAYGQLGDGTTTNRPVPVRVMANARAVVAGNFHTLVLKTDGTLWSWGWNGFGQLGDGTTTDRPVAVPVLSGSGVSGIAAGGNASFMIRADRTVWSWGIGYAGIPGPGTWGPAQPTPVQNQFLRDIVKIGTGGGHVLALTGDGRVLAWGSNRSQQLGIPRMTKIATPLKIRDLLEPYGGAGLVVEFFNPAIRNGAGVPGIGHYFITADPDEVAAIDNGSAGPGWSRTGRTFRAWTDAASAPPGAVGVCRFYAAVPNSHFYTADPEECLDLRQQNPTNSAARGWRYESTAFYTVAPQEDACPGGYFPVYRSYNNRYSPNPAQNDGNHRITPSYGDYQFSVRFSGHADEGVAFCSPATASLGADLESVLTYGGPAIRSADAVTVEFLFGNNGPGRGDGSTVHAALPPEVSGWTIRCTARGGASCPGTLTADALRAGQGVAVWPAGGGLTLTASGTAPGVSQGTSTTLSFGAIVSGVSGSPDPLPANDAPVVSKTIVKSAVACSYGANPTNLSLNADSQSASFRMITGAGCGWIAQSGAPAWLSITPATGAGDGTLTIVVAANPQPVARSGAIAVGGQSVVVTQAGAACAYASAPEGLSFTSAVQGGTIAMSAQSGCGWTATTGAAWLKVAPASGNGSATLAVSVELNNDANARTAAVSFGNRSVLVTQAAGAAPVPPVPPPRPDPCATLRLGRLSDQQSWASLSGAVSIPVFAEDQCAWQARSNTAWVTLTSGGGGTGNGVVRYLIEANIVEQPRTGELNIGGQTFTIVQTRYTGIDPQEPGGR